MAKDKTAEELRRQQKTTSFTVEKMGHVAILMLDAPEKLNALSMYWFNYGENPYFRNSREAEWAAKFADVKYDQEINVIIITGSGRGFCTGADVKQWGATSAEVLRTGKTRISPTVINEGSTLSHEWIRLLKKPTIAMVNGPAIGIGADLALMCDLIVMSNRAFFQWSDIQRGMVPANGACWLLPRLVGKAKAKELLLTGERVYADEALHIGLANKVVPFEQLRDVTIELAAKIANGHRNAVQLTRFAVDVSEVQSLRDNLDLTSVCNSMTSETVIRVMAMDREYKKTKLGGSS